MTLEDSITALQTWSMAIARWQLFTHGWLLSILLSGGISFFILKSFHTLFPSLVFYSPIHPWPTPYFFFGSILFTGAVWCVVAISGWLLRQSLRVSYQANWPTWLSEPKTLIGLWVSEKLTNWLQHQSMTPISERPLQAIAASLAVAELDLPTIQAQLVAWNDQALKIDSELRKIKQFNQMLLQIKSVITEALADTSFYQSTLQDLNDLIRQSREQQNKLTKIKQQSQSLGFKILELRTPLLTYEAPWQWALLQHTLFRSEAQLTSTAGADAELSPRFVGPAIPTKGRLDPESDMALRQHRLPYADPFEIASSGSDRAEGNDALIATIQKWLAKSITAIGAWSVASWTGSGIMGFLAAWYVIDKTYLSWKPLLNRLLPFFKLPMQLSAWFAKRSEGWLVHSMVTRVQAFQCNVLVIGVPKLTEPVVYSWLRMIHETLSEFRIMEGMITPLAPNHGIAYTTCLQKLDAHVNQLIGDFLLNQSVPRQRKSTLKAELMRLKPWLSDRVVQAIEAWSANRQPKRSLMTDVSMQLALQTPLAPAQPTFQPTRCALMVDGETPPQTTELEAQDEDIRQLGGFWNRLRCRSRR